MSDVIIPYRFQVKRDTAANFAAANTLLRNGEFGLETDTRKLKLGDGTTTWNSLDYINAAAWPYDNGVSGLTAVDVQAAIDEIAEAAGSGGGGGGGAWEFVDEVVVGVAAAQITFSGLDLNADGSYLVEVRSAPSSTGDQSVFLEFNGDVNDYQRQVSQFNGSATTFARTSSRYAFWGFTASVASATSYTMSASIRIAKITGKYPVSRIEASSVTSGGIATEINSHVWQNTSNVTSITLAKGGNFAVGTVCRLYRSAGAPAAVNAASVETSAIPGVSASNNVQAVLEELASRIAAIE